MSTAVQPISRPVHTGGGCSVLSVHGGPRSAAQFFGRRSSNPRNRSRFGWKPDRAELDHQRLHVNLRQPSDGSRCPRR